MMIEYKLVGHAMYHIVINEVVVGTITYTDLGHMRTKQWVARPYYGLNHKTFVGHTRYHAVKLMMRELLRFTPWLL